VTEDPAGHERRAPAADPQGNQTSAPVIKHWFEYMLTWSRQIVLIPVVFLLLDAIGAFAYGSAVFVAALTRLHLATRIQVESILGKFLVVMDAYLVGATLLIAAFGFYELFIAREQGSQRFWMPSWLKMHDLEDLKARVVSMLILVAAITFVDAAIAAQNEQSVLYLGIGISIVIAALTAFLKFGRTHGSAYAHATSTASASGKTGYPLDHQEDTDYPDSAG